MKYCISCLICFSLFLSQNISAQVAKANSPNIIFILTDDLGYGDVGVFFQNKRQAKNDRSKPFVLTPNLDKMAKAGAILPQQYCAAPVCAPSRASILLGQSQGHANVRDNQFDKALADNYTLGNLLQKAGYATVAIGKWGLQGKEWTAHPLKRGFDYYYGYIGHGDGHEHYPKEGLYRGKKNVWENYTEVSQGLDNCYTGDLWTAKAKQWIIDHQKSNQSKQPFFMYLAYDTPHAVLELPTSAYPDGAGLNGGLKWIGTTGKMINTAVPTPDSWVHPDYAKATYDDDSKLETPEKPWPDTYKRFATSTRRIDDQVGDILKLLQDLAIDSNTLVVFSSDNGPSIESYLPKPYVRYDANFFQSFGPFDGIKRDVLDGGMRMPVLAAWKGHIPANTVISSPSISYDWMPTFLDAAGLPGPAVSDGVSLLPSLTKKGKQQNSLIYTEYFEGGKTPSFTDFAPVNRGRIRKQMQMIRIDNIVGVRYDIKSHEDNFQFFDILKDPHQQYDLSKEKNMLSMQQRIKDKVLQIRRSNRSAPRPYDSLAVPSINRFGLGSGLIWKTFKSNTDWIPEVYKLKPLRSGKTETFQLKNLEQSGNLILFEGYIKIPADGNYTFYWSDQKKGLLRLHQSLIIDADYGYVPGDGRQSSLNLKSGLHPIKLYYQKGNAKSDEVKLEWSGPNFSRQKISADFLFH